MTLATLSEAIEWVSGRWDQQRPAPVRVHVREATPTSKTKDRKGCSCLACTTDGHGYDAAMGSADFSGRMYGALDGRPDQSSAQLRTVQCYHPLLAARMSPRDCPECWGVGVKDAKVDRYDYPMTLALDRLSKSLRPRRQPHPYRLITALADHGWDARATARSMDLHYDLAEPLFLQALRKLHGRYEEGPVRIPYHDKSESQQRAEAVPIAS